MKTLLISGFMMLTTLLQAQVTWPKVDGRVVPFELFSSFKMPGDNLTIELPVSASAKYSVTLNGEQKGTFEEGVYTLTAPSAHGLYQVKVLKNNNPILTLQLFVMTSISRKEGQYLNGYRIGNYPVPLGEGKRFRRPLGFIELSADMLEAQVSPNFKLKQFVPKQKGNPKYMILRENLLFKLEYLLKEVNKAYGKKVSTFTIMQGFMTPHANAEAGYAIYSRFPYGDAVNFMVDTDGNGLMDDLNKDGKLDMKDTRWLYDLIEGLSQKQDFQVLEGGLAHYKRPKKRSGYIYIDARGRKLRF